jgi:hypothetical protein
MNITTIHPDSGNPTRRTLGNTNESAGVVRAPFGIEHILLVSGWAQVFDSAVCWIAINVVNLCKDFIKVVSPYQTMKIKQFAINPNLRVSGFGLITCFSAFAAFAFGLPKKLAFAVREKLTDMGWTDKISFVHAVAPLCNGLGSNGSGFAVSGRCAILPPQGKK